MNDEWIFRPEFDLRFEQQLDLDLDLVWRCWTEVELIKRWHPPMRLEMHECEVDVRPGGEFRTVLRSESGELLPELRRRYVEVLPHERLTFSDRLQAEAGEELSPLFTHRIELEQLGAGVHFRAYAIHATEQERELSQGLGLVETWIEELDRLLMVGHEV